MNMTANKLKFLLPLALASAVPAVQAAQVQVTWDQPEGYRDVRATSEGQGRFRERVLAELGDYFKTGAQTLPADQTLVVNVTDLDLAGYIEYFHPRYPFGVRVIRDVDFPRMTLNYELRDGNGNVIGAGSGKLADLGFRTPAFVIRDQDPLKYEKQMIDRWYQDNFTAVTGS